MNIRPIGIAALCSLPDQGFKPLRAVAPDVGLRAAYYPLRFFGVEAEGGVMPARLVDEDGGALLYTVRGQLVGQLALWSITPFVLVGAGGLGVSSPREALGKDIDPALHFGGGVKFYNGDREHNLDLSKRRAESVKRYLVEHGIEESRVQTDGFGPDKPVDTNDTKAGRANNRRIEFEIIRRAK